MRKDLKYKFAEMCMFIEPSSNGMMCPFEDFESDDDLSYISLDKDYPILKEKMEKLLVLINEDMSLLNKDIETELWEMI